MDARLRDQLIRIVGRQHLDTSPEELACYSYDASGSSPPPQAVIFPQDARQIREVLLLANAHRFPVIPRGAGSGMSGGALPIHGGVVLALNRLNRILEIDPCNMIAVVEPGVITGELQKTLASSRLYYPPDPASLKFCTVGGNAAECAGGPSAVKYGVTRDYVIGLEVVLPTGEIMQTGVRTEKGVTGYDLTRLFVGSEGTLGVFTKLVLRLLPLPEEKATLLLVFPSMEQATALVAEILAADIHPCTLEYMDHNAISVVSGLLPEPLPPAVRALLLVEIDGTRREVASGKLDLQRFLDQHGVSYRIAKDPGEQKALWQARRAISPATFQLKPHKISEDVVVPRSRIPELVAFTTELGQRLGLTVLTFGHAGDGNIHVNIMLDKNDPYENTLGEQAKEELFTKVLVLGGTLSGEHGIGITKMPFLPMEIDPVALGLMRRIKTLFDPNNILNPGKIFPSSGETT